MLEQRIQDTPAEQPKDEMVDEDVATTRAVIQHRADAARNKYV